MNRHNDLHPMCPARYCRHARTSVDMDHINFIFFDESRDALFSGFESDRSEFAGRVENDGKCQFTAVVGGGSRCIFHSMQKENSMSKRLQSTSRDVHGT